MTTKAHESVNLVKHATDSAIKLDSEQQVQADKRMCLSEQGWVELEKMCVSE